MKRYILDELQDGSGWYFRANSEKQAELAYSLLFGKSPRRIREIKGLGLWNGLFRDSAQIIKEML